MSPETNRLSICLARRSNTLADFIVAKNNRQEKLPFPISNSECPPAPAASKSKAATTAALQRARKYAARFLLVTTLTSDHLSSLRPHPVPASAKSMARKTFQWPRKKSTVPSDRPNKALESGESRAITAA
jgi:hypothetical protein